MFFDNCFQKSYGKFSFLGESHSAKKNEKWPAIAEI